MGTKQIEEEIEDDVAEGTAPRLFSTHGAAEYLGLSYDQVKHYIRVGEDHPNRLVPDLNDRGTVAFTQQTLDRWNRIPRSGRGRPKAAAAA